jgi:LemA protein
MVSMDGTAVLVIGVAAIVLLGVVVLMMYNGLVRARLRVREAWSAIQVQLQRRASLIPNLVETVKGYASHERGTLEQVTQARAALQSAGSPAQAAEANNVLTGALRTLFAVAEAYPDLKANQNFLALQRDLADTEDKISYARTYYNANVRQYNERVHTIPTAIIAGMFGFHSEQFFQASAESWQDVQVRFGQ